MTGPSARADAELALHRSPTDGSLELLYQPEIEFATGTIVAMEGLLRWRYDEVVLSPGDFLELAEQTGAIRPIGHWVLRAGVAEAGHWQGIGGPQRQLWLNVSAGQVREPGFAALVAGTLAEYALPADALGLELSETTVRELGDEAAPLLQDLRAAGVALAVDNFASWFSALGCDGAAAAVRRQARTAARPWRRPVRRRAGRGYRHPGRARAGALRRRRRRGDVG